ALNGDESRKAPPFQRWSIHSYGATISPRGFPGAKHASDLCLGRRLLRNWAAKFERPILLTTTCDESDNSAKQPDNYHVLGHHQRLPPHSCPCLRIVRG